MVVDPVFFLGTLFLQLGIEVVRQLAFAMPVAFAWEFERDIAWWSTDRRLENGALLITGFAAGMISALMWSRNLGWLSSRRPMRARPCSPT